MINLILVLLAPIKLSFPPTHIGNSLKRMCIVNDSSINDLHRLSKLVHADIDSFALDVVCVNSRQSPMWLSWPKSKKYCYIPLTIL